MDHGFIWLFFTEYCTNAKTSYLLNQTAAVIGLKWEIKVLLVKYNIILGGNNPSGYFKRFMLETWEENVETTKCRTYDWRWLSQGESEKGAEIIFSTHSQWQQWPLCQLVPCQFEEVESAPGRLCLAWSHYRRSAGPGPNLQACSQLSQQSDPHFTLLSLGASQGAGGAWGFQLQR